MKKLVMLLLMGLLAFGGCIKANVIKESLCPPVESYFMVENPDGERMVIHVSKGYFNNKDNWLTKEEYIEWEKERMKELEEGEKLEARNMEEIERVLSFVEMFIKSFGRINNE